MPPALEPLCRLMCAKLRLHELGGQGSAPPNRRAVRDCDRRPASITPRPASPASPALPVLGPRGLRLPTPQSLAHPATAATARSTARALRGALWWRPRKEEFALGQFASNAGARRSAFNAAGARGVFDWAPRDPTRASSATGLFLRAGRVVASLRGRPPVVGATAPPPHAAQRERLSGGGRQRLRLATPRLPAGAAATRRAAPPPPSVPLFKRGVQAFGDRRLAPAPRGCLLHRLSPQPLPSARVKHPGRTRARRSAWARASHLPNAPSERRRLVARRWTPRALGAGRQNVRRAPRRFLRAPPDGSVLSHPVPQAVGGRLLALAPRRFP
ncbi:hypothetical protein BD626DRAFT_534216 [Schizophyllum amplum]|uniref:Uncharacterized protein n=1 Tax=Schizophyllum amplum TaxID=97359 RepID=A0A550CT82_9AGAR|nr:hypothetical protein BD626DRAFT_534216 [Auriculariopsis ampla]